MKNIFLAIIFLFVLDLASAQTIVFRPLTAGSMQPITTFIYRIYLSNNIDCSSPLLDTGSIYITTDNYGIYVYDLDISSLTSVPSYYCEYRNGNLRIVLNFSDIVFRTLRVNNIYSNNWSNVSISSYQISGFTNYYPSSINLTSVAYNGSLISGNLRGYAAANAICNASFIGSHLCNEFEVSLWFAKSLNPNIDNDTWVIAGGPKYIPSSIPCNDCNAFTYSGGTSYVGNYFHINSTTGGDSRAITCNTKLPLACCVY